MRIIVFSYIRIFAEALTSYIENYSKHLQVSFCQETNSLIQEIQCIEPDIVLVDITSEQALRDTRAAYTCCQNTAFVALAVPEVAHKVIACADAGFVAYIPRTASLSELINIMDRALKGECISDPKIVGSLFQEMRRRNGNNESIFNTQNKTLTLRECEILGLIAQGLVNKAIARKLNVSLSTVKNHLHNVFTKLQVNGRSEALTRIKNEPWLAQRKNISERKNFIN